MNPSYNSGGTNVPSVKPGTIASGPAPNNGNVPSVKPGTIASGPAPAGGAMPAGGVAPAQPQQNRYIPPSSMNPAPVMPMSGGVSKKPKKGIIIGGILIVVALALGIAAVVLMPRGGDTNNLQNDASLSIPQELIDAYSSFIYYLVSGVDTQKNADVSGGLLASGTKIKVDNYILSSSSDEKTQYFNTLCDKYNTFVDIYKKQNNVPELSSVVESYYCKVLPINVMLPEEIIALYNQQGFDMAVESVNNMYSSDISNENVKKILEDWKISVVAQLSAYRDLNLAGCEYTVDNRSSQCEVVYRQNESNYGSQNDNAIEDALKIITSMKEDASDNMNAIYDFIYPSLPKTDVEEVSDE